MNLWALAFTGAALFWSVSVSCEAALHMPASLKSAPACMGAGRMVSQAAYVPAEQFRPLQCGHLLSTDTVITVRHWRRT